MSLMTTAIRRPVGTSLLMLAMTQAGAASFFLLPAAPVPLIDYPVYSGLRGVSADRIAARPRPQFAKIHGASLTLQSVRDIRMGGKSSSAPFQYTLQSDDLEDLRAWTPRRLEKLRRGKVMLDVASDHQDKGLRTEVTVDRANASRLGLTAAQIDNTVYDAFGQRQVSTIFEPSTSTMW